jgi:hypothetical protein
MRRFALSLLTVGSCCATLAAAAPVDEHIRGQIVSVRPDTLLVHTSDGLNVSIALNEGTHYLLVVPTNGDSIEPGSYIGTATKNTGSSQIALEVMIFPAAMRGINPGHFPYDRLPDTTVAGGATVASMMTNGDVEAVGVSAGGTVSTMMTNGDVAARASQNGLKKLTITYKGGQQTILVPPTAPIVKLVPMMVSGLAGGAFVFVDSARDGDSFTANLVAVGAEGLKPPF